MSTESPVLALKAHEHHVAKRDIHKNQLSQLTNLVRDFPKKSQVDSQLKNKNLVLCHSHKTVKFVLSVQM